MATTKIQLSPEESELVQNSGWILSKHLIIKKVYEMFGELSRDLTEISGSFTGILQPGINPNGKISKGENYLSLPYVILDQPSCFGKEKIFAVRSMFWWGNFFSITLHLSGSFKDDYIKDAAGIHSFLRDNDFFICTGEDQWQHHFDEDNYRPVTVLSLNDFTEIMNRDFFKVSKKISLSEWNNAQEFLKGGFNQLMQMLQISCQGGKKDL
jgi:hypothetical protein